MTWQEVAPLFISSRHLAVMEFIALVCFFSSLRKVNILRAGTSLPGSWLEHCQHALGAQYKGTEIACLIWRGEMCFLPLSSCQERVTEPLG